MHPVTGVVGQNPGKTTALALRSLYLAGNLRADTRFCDFRTAGGLLYF